MTSRAEGMETSKQSVHRNWGAVVTLAVAFVLSGLSMLGVMQIEQTLKEGGWTVAGSGPAIVTEGLSEGFEGRGRTNVTLAVTDTRHEVGDPEFNERVQPVIERVTADAALEVTSTVGWLSGPAIAANYIGEDSRTVLTIIGSDLLVTEATTVLGDLQTQLDTELEGSGLEARLVSPDAFWGQINADSLSGLVMAELIALPLIILVLLILYRSVAAVGVSMLSTGIAIVLSLGTVNLIGQFVELSSFTLNAVTMLGLGVCVDYTLFVVRRYQRELAAGRSPDEALAVTRRTSGHTVIASGLTIAAAMAALFLVDLAIIRSLALGVIVVVLFSLLVSVTVAPAMLQLLGRNVNWGRVRIPGRKARVEASESAISGSARLVVNRPIASLIFGALGLGLLAIPAVQLTTFTPDARIVNTEAPSRQGYDVVAEQFSIGSTAPIQVLLSTDDGDFTDLDFEEVTSLIEEFERIEHVDRVRSPLNVLTEVSPQDPFAALGTPVMDALPEEVTQQLGVFLSSDRTKMLVEVEVDDWAASDATRSTLEQVNDTLERADVSGITWAVGGETAQGVVSNAEIANALPWVVALMLVVIFVLLLVTFRSIVIPLVAIGVNLLSVGATYGLMVLVFQHGFLADLLGFQVLGYVQNFVPVLLLALLFSLATDYQVFLISRVREEYLRTGDNTTAIAKGLTATAPLITGAALLMVVVFGAFAFTGVVPIQQLGFGLAVGIALDATIVRMIVVPAALRLTGRATWWFPGTKPPTPQPSEA
ncbi:MMPL family transporter [Corynebacterium glaucum]|uniref:MMPL family transporter n=1 Tax=Corynebacterium glaucum TaxID=187491 RepID=UPI00265A8427|nr:MMPL family transporter [Corynebacterium glaucum]